MSLVRTIASLTLLGLLGSGIAGLATTIAVVDHYAKDLPDHRHLASYVPRTGSQMLADDGSMTSRKVEQRRTFVPIAQIPPLVAKAFLSAEDRNYASHNGIDPVAILRAVASNASGSIVSGGSTITQQVAKNLLVGSERSFDRKAREALLAMRMDRDLGKDRVLEIYLNEIYLGLGAYGVAEAAETYFGKKLAALSPDEAALIAAMPKAPSAFNPVRNPSRALERRNYVLRRMVEDGVLPADGLAQIQALPIRLADRKREMGDETQDGWFDEAAWKVVSQELGDVAQKQDVIVKTTLRPATQQAAQAALRAGILRADQALGWKGPEGRVRLPVDWSDPKLDPPEGSGDFSVGVVEAVGAEAAVAIGPGQRVRLGSDGMRWTGRGVSALSPGDVVLLDLSGQRPALVQVPDVDGALVALDPKTGDVLALVGGYSRQRSSFDRATMAKRQAGSSFKPLLYATALQMGFDATSPLLDAAIALEQGPNQVDWRPSDAKAAGKGGLITVRRALELSRNLATVRLLWTLGLEDIQPTLAGFGITPDRGLTYTAALGAVEVTPIQMASAYAAFANGGRRVVPRFVKSVTTRDGNALKTFDPVQGTPILDEIASAQMASILKGVVERGTARRAFEGFKRPFAGKTGTTNSARDAWFVGFSPEIVVAVWIGRDDNKALADDAGGGKVAAPVVRDFLEKAGVNLSDVPIPPSAKTVTVDPDSGLPSRQGIVEIVREIPDAPVGARAAQRQPPRERAPAARYRVRGGEQPPSDYEPSAPLSIVPFRE